MITYDFQKKDNCIPLAKLQIINHYLGLAEKPAKCSLGNAAELASAQPTDGGGDMAGGKAPATRARAVKERQLALIEEPARDLQSVDGRELQVDDDWEEKLNLSVKIMCVGSATAQCGAVLIGLCP